MPFVNCISVLVVQIIGCSELLLIFIYIYICILLIYFCILLWIDHELPLAAAFEGVGADRRAGGHDVGAGQVPELRDVGGADGAWHSEAGLQVRSEEDGGGRVVGRSRKEGQTSKSKSR